LRFFALVELGWSFLKVIDGEAQVTLGGGLRAVAEESFTRELRGWTRITTARRKKAQGPRERALQGIRKWIVSRVRIV
jgi:hypothetical protein